jgi:tetratricopeptide (TPR) repeat protein
MLRRSNLSFGVPLVALVVGISLLSACATRRLAFEPEELRRAIIAADPGVDPEEVVVPFEIDDTLMRRLRLPPPSQRGEQQFLEALADAIVDPDRLGLRYDPTTTSSARDSAELGRGNCLSLASIVVGVARQRGMRAYYVEGYDRKLEVDEKEDLLISRGHIGAVVVASDGHITMDFGGELSRFRRYRFINDLEAAANFYNNLGYQQIAVAGVGADSWTLARRSFELAARISPEFAPAWNNLGIAEARLGRTEEAMAHYRRAIEADPGFSSPYTNLGGLYLRVGNPELAVEQLSQATRLDPENPYLHFSRAQALIEVGRLDDGRRALERSLRLKSDYDEARVLLERLAN